MSETIERIKCLIIGSGPAGYTAAIYAARADLKPVMYTGMEPGGQLTTTTEVDNFPGYPEGIDGPTMMVQLQQQAERFGTEVRIGMVTAVEFSDEVGGIHKITVDNSTKIEAEDLNTSISEVLEKISSLDKKPVIEIKIIGKDIERDVIQTKISQIIPKTLHCSWKMLQSEDASSVLLNRPARINDELLKLAINALKSEKLANFAVKELYPLLSSNQLDQATQLVIENFEQFKRDKK